MTVESLELTTPQKARAKGFKNLMAYFGEGISDIEAEQAIAAMDLIKTTQEDIESVDDEVGK